jgi:ligand-binding sensor domain-containing protein
MYSQEYSYTHYDSKEGLASSTVYCMTQDRDGFLWFGTETGLSRFDGTHFTNFTKEEGLSDNDIIQVFADSKGRVWISPFKKNLCYYYRGAIHNSNNDSLLQKLRIQDNVVHFAEDLAGNILLQETSRLHLVQPNGEVSTILTIRDKPLGYVTHIGRRSAGGFWVMLDGNLYSYVNSQFTLVRTVPHIYDHLHFNYASINNDRLLWQKNPVEINVFSMGEGRVFHFPIKKEYEYINSVVIDDRFVASCTLEGALVYDLKNPGNEQHHLRGVAISNAFKDAEGSWWFSTMGKGIYRLNSSVALNAQLTERRVLRYRLGTSLGSKEWKQAYSTFNLVNKYATQNGTWDDQSTFAWYNQLPIFSMLTLKDNSVMLGAKFFLTKHSPGLTKDGPSIGSITVKAMCKHRNNIIVATEKCVLTVRTDTLKILDTIWRERATCVFSNNDTIYIGSLNGLYQLIPGKEAISLGENTPALQGRIAGICEDANHIIWAATSGDGLVGWRNGEVIKRISRRDGLSSNICRTLFYENGKLWVGTNKGVSRIEILQPGMPIQKYSTSDGLSSDIIDAIYVTNKKVFIGTPEGITFFDEEKMNRASRCDLQIIDVAISGETYYPANAPLTIPHEKNNIQFNYVGISYKSGGDIRYRYRLMGLDSAWKETRETILNYPTLPSGDYSLQLQAINKFGVYSKVLSTRFTIEKLSYEKTWFKVLMGLLFLAVTGLLVWIIIQRIRKREQEKTATNKRISELEQLSRKAQMNPHFIFNSLNSIQQYVMDADIAGANKFISGFSRLIRQTLDFSSKPEISMEEELDYLTNYLDIEKTRLEDTFSWCVEIGKGVDPADYYIPPMILQPFVENSVRHGLRFRRDKDGLVTISVNREDDYLVCILEDNGVGRKAAMKYKSISPINYQSKGMSLTADRIAMFNKENDKKITMYIDDLEDDKQNALGTRVTIRFPVL